MFLKISQYSQENTCVWVAFEKWVPTHVFSCEYCRIFKNSFFIEYLRWLLLTSICVVTCKCNKISLNLFLQLLILQALTEIREAPTWKDLLGQYLRFFYTDFVYMSKILFRLMFLFKILHHKINSPGKNKSSKTTEVFQKMSTKSVL